VISRWPQPGHSSRPFKRPVDDSAELFSEATRSELFAQNGPLDSRSRRTDGSASSPLPEPCLAQVVVTSCRLQHGVGELQHGEAGEVPVGTPEQGDPVVQTEGGDTGNVHQSAFHMTFTCESPRQWAGRRCRLTHWDGVSLLNSRANAPRTTGRGDRGIRVAGHSPGPGPRGDGRRDRVASL
jgi:hypothetical protein